MPSPFSAIAICMLAGFVATAQPSAPPPDQPTNPALEIMNRMAANMDSATEARRQYVYQQKVKARLIRTNGQVARQEDHEYTATPESDHTAKQLVSFNGEYHKSKKEIIKYTEPGYKTGGMDIDGELIEDLVKSLVNDEKSRDGIPHSMFPLRAKDLPHYKFTLLEPTTHKGRSAHRIAFEPVTKSGHCLNIGGDDYDDCNSRPWKGEVLVDAEDLQPIRIATDLTFKMPWGVKVFLGTNLRQTGFSVSYVRVAPNVWFPSTYGTEFKLDLLFGYKRVITLALDSSDFKKTSTSSDVKFQAEGH